MDQSRNLILALDLGGTNLRAVLATPSGTFLSHVRIPTRAVEGVDAVLGRMKDVLRSAVAEARRSWEEVAAIGIGAPGPLDHDTGVIFEPPNLPGWQQVPLKQIFEAEFQRPTYVANDANLGAVAEHRYGQAKGLEHLIYITVSTGIGGGIVSHGRLLVGAGGTAAEVGHTTVDPAGPRCGCGNNGCAEAIAAGPAIARAALWGLQHGRESSLARLKRDLRQLTAEDVVHAAQEGDTFAREVLREAGTALGVLCANLVNILNPQMIVIGGGVTNAGELLFQPARQVMEARALFAASQHVRIVRSELGDDIVLYGAVAWALQHVES